jgi:hypothetical protein
MGCTNHNLGRRGSLERSTRNLIWFYVRGGTDVHEPSSGENRRLQRATGTGADGGCDL